MRVFARARSDRCRGSRCDGIDVAMDVIGAQRDIAEALAAMLTEVGIRTRVQVWEGAVITPLWLLLMRRIAFARTMIPSATLIAAYPLVVTSVGVAPAPPTSSASTSAIVVSAEVPPPGSVTV